ncbi:uncharacterized protein LOC130712873 [Lotus japonicus]|uniref:uncharacterized protein LOC130712873 n=1 Tax=Lotus japonicus TaxID=34305 RepID=UPI00258B2CB4|nr:uncharacterized protein LOC130712873 [Lotus japonicus]
MILMDDKGCKIHASVRKTLIYRFQSFLSGGCVYHISFFGVGESGRDFRPTSHPFKINFDIHTSVRLVPNKTINLSPYNFVPISDIMFKVLDTSFLIDVIGILTGASGEQEFEKYGTKQKIITIELDQDGYTCTMFLESNDTAVRVISPLQDSAKKSTLEDDFLKQSDEKTIEQLKDLADV